MQKINNKQLIFKTIFFALTLYYKINNKIQLKIKKFQMMKSKNIQKKEDKVLKKIVIKNY